MARGHSQNTYLHTHTHVFMCGLVYVGFTLNKNQHWLIHWKQTQNMRKQSHPTENKHIYSVSNTGLLVDVCQQCVVNIMHHRGTQKRSPGHKPFRHRETIYIYLMHTYRENLSHEITLTSPEAAGGENLFLVKHFKVVYLGLFRGTTRFQRYSTAVRPRRTINKSVSISSQQLRKESRERIEVWHDKALWTQKEEDRFAMHMIARKNHNETFDFCLWKGIANSYSIYDPCIYVYCCIYISSKLPNVSWSRAFDFATRETCKLCTKCQTEHDEIAMGERERKVVAVDPHNSDREAKLKSRIGPHCIRRSILAKMTFNYWMLAIPKSLGLLFETI